jgi:hypothetical protein
MAIIVRLTEEESHSRALAGRWLSFRDDATYYALAPYFNRSGGCVLVDPHSTVSLQGAELKELAMRLKQSRHDYEKNPPKWEVWTSTIAKAGRDTEVKHYAEKAHVLTLIDGILEMVAAAQAANHGLLFVGD